MSALYYGKLYLRIGERNGACGFGDKPWAEADIGKVTCAIGL